MRGQAFKAPTLTKRQRKKIRNKGRGLDCARAISLQEGVTIEMSDRSYRGRTPLYEMCLRPDGIQEFMQVGNGVPFVRIQAQ